MEPYRLFPVTTRIDHQGRLWIGGSRLADLADQFGTPLYVFDEATLRARCREARAAVSVYPGEARVAYASKAFLCLGLAQLMASEGLGLDVVSGGELACARMAGFPRDRVHLHGNNKSREELRAALEWGIGTIVIDGFLELEMLRGLTAGDVRVDHPAQGQVLAVQQLLVNVIATFDPE